jgi:O-glycosyl hydrolase
VTRKPDSRWQCGVVLLTVSLLVSNCGPREKLGPTLTPTTTRTPKPTPTFEPTPTPLPPDTVLVMPEQPQQTVREVAGGSFVYRFSKLDDGAPDPIGAYNLNNLDVRYARFEIYLAGWEPTNDNDDAHTTNMEAFQDTGLNTRTFMTMQDFQNRNIQIVASVWDVPNWMVENPDRPRERILLPEMQAELVESLVAWLLTARDKYGVKVSYISVNEPDMGVNLLMSPVEQAELIRQAVPRFEEAGLATKWLVAECAHMVGCQWDAQLIYNDETIRPYLGPLAIHSWDSDSHDKDIADLGDYALEQEIEIWVTEAGWNPDLWQSPERFPTWQNALSLARVYSLVLKLARVNVLLYWQMAGYDYQLNDGTQPYPAFDILHQFKEQIPEGSQVVETSPNLDHVYVLAVQAPSHFMVHLINDYDKPQTITLVGIPDGTYYHIQSDATETLQLLETYTVAKDPVQITLAERSVNVLTTRAP